MSTEAASACLCVIFPHVGGGGIALAQRLLRAEFLTPAGRAHE